MLHYELYKPSGVEWMGSVPSHWEVLPLRAVTTLKSDRNRPDLPVLSVYREYGVILKDSRDDNHNATSLDTSNYKVVNEGDLVVNKMKAWQGSMGVSPHRGIVSPAYITCSTDADRVQPTYLHYLLRSSPLIGVYNALSYGVRVGQWDMHYEDFKQIPIPLPPRVEQTRIVSFLDKKTAEIDTAIAMKQRLIELLQEQKSILINQAVTRGLNPDVTMRDSGVEWIGQIPANWQTIPLKYVSSVQSGVTLGKSYSQLNGIKSYPYLRVANVQNGFLDLSDIAEINLPVRHAKNYFLKAEDILVTEGGDIDKLGRGACWYGEIEECLHQNHVFAIRIIRTVLPEFVSLITGVAYARQYFTTTANKTTNLASTNKTKLGNLPLLVPPIDEQKNILSHCENLRAQFDVLLGGVAKEIAVLKEMKSTLIAESVTGKLRIS
ncbi:restriction endonuclease subunit S [Deefgea salmonis]|uniref:Restriction endonuclease subunit S n=1 Tax=Deefgea salmonis TaxID=2875502 RepID=A0ABS8BJ11_9NEIS|nr:restriction endonuclease subunit S [Deefgea salmonis]MCB5195701.1 restriction endonuclease subunit S [Deefgea salmonis]